MLASSSLPKTIASRYRPIRLIASGGMGTVYEVEHLVTGERLALKVLWSNANASPEALARFRHEVRASALIRSDHVVRAIDADIAPELDNAPFLVMELLEGTDLERAAQQSPPAPAVALEWLRQVARAIDKAHLVGIVHRDLKPENLFLTTRSDGTGLVKVLDFGIVKMIEEGTGATGTGQILGTPKYMAPEQASASGRITPATDRCALGLIAYRLLTGESYYQGGMMIVLGELLHGQLQAPSERASRLGTAFDAWFAKACNREPEQRFASASQQVEALAVALGLPSLPVRALSGTARTFRWGWRRGTTGRALLAGAAATLIVAVAVGSRHPLRTHPAPWGCLGHVAWADSRAIPPKINIKTVAVCGQCGVGGEVIADAPGGTPITGARVRICSVADPGCVHPLAGGDTDGGGAATLQIDTSLYRPPLLVFVEYVKAGLANTLVYLNKPLVFDLDVGHVELLDEKSNLEPTAAEFGATYDPKRAAVDVFPVDCNGRSATKDVALTWLDRDGATVTRDYFAYTQGAIAMNLPVNAAAITRIVARESATGRLIATASAVIRPGANTEVRLAPAP